MKQQMTASEVWYEFEQYIRHGGLGSGLCHFTAVLACDGVISRRQEARLDAALARRFKPKGLGYGAHGNYFWPVGAEKPRIAACCTMRRLAQARERGRK